MTQSEAREAVKDRLYIDDSITTFDDLIDDLVDQGVNRLYPIVQKETAIQTASLSVDDYGEAIVDLTALSTPLDDVRKVEVSSGYQYYPPESFYRHAGNLHIRGIDTSVVSAKLFGLVRYQLTDLSSEFELPVLWYAVSEFYDTLAGDKRRFNVYQQASGGRAVDDMRQEADYFETKANAYVADRATIYGSA